MLYHLLTPLTEYWGALRLFNYITFRAAGAVVTGVSDVKGAIWNPQGLDIRQLEAHIAESGSVVAAVPYFAHVNGDVLRRPNVRVRVDDGRNFLRLTKQRYDVVTADLIQPVHQPVQACEVPPSPLDLWIPSPSCSSASAIARRHAFFWSVEKVTSERAAFLASRASPAICSANVI